MTPDYISDRYTVMSHLPGRADIQVKADCEAQQAIDVIARVQTVRRSGEMFYTIPPLPDTPEAVIEKFRHYLEMIVTVTTDNSVEGKLAREALK